MPTGPIHSIFQRPVGSFVAPVEPVPTECSLRAAAAAMTEEGLPGLAVTQEGRYSGTIYEIDLIRALAQGADPDSPVGEWTKADRPVLRMYDTGAEALRLFEESGAPLIAVVDDRGIPAGIVTPARLIEPPALAMRPKMVGGMATPFGVYLTNGAVRGGVPQTALIVTGMAMFGLFLVANYAVLAVTHLLPINILAHPITRPLAEASVFVLFLLGLRLAPISGTHGAEHMVVHAIERGEALIPETVRRMPRVHPRCGTNLAVGAMIFLGIFTLEWTPYQDVRLLAAFLTTMIAWRPLGAILQQWVTTKRPTSRQLQTGIEAGEDLLRRYQSAAYVQPSILTRLVNSGLFHIMAGALAVQLVAYLVMVILNVPPDWRVF